MINKIDMRKHGESNELSYSWKCRFEILHSDMNKVFFKINCLIIMYNECISLYTIHLSLIFLRPLGYRELKQILLLDFMI